jgi:MFS family permease
VPRRLLALIGVVVLVDTMLYAALAPLLPSLEREFGLSKTEAGALVAAYPVGTLLGAIPGGWLAARYGPRPVVVAGLLTMTVTGVTFALAQSIALLDAARFLQGIGGALTWTAGLAWVGMAVAPERRGEALGFAIGAAIFGAQFGPVVGVVAEIVGRAPAFVAVALLGLVLAAAAQAEPRPPRQTGRGVRPVLLLRDRAFLGAAALTFVPSLAFGAGEVLIPLRLDELGATALGIGAAFLAAALAEAVVSPLAGRLVDRRGTLQVVRVATLAGAAVVGALWIPESPIMLAALLVAFAVVSGLLMTPSGKLVSLRSERLGVDQAWAFAFSNTGWSAGVALGAAAGGALGQVVGDWLPYGLCAALLAVCGAVALRLRDADRPRR